MRTKLKILRNRELLRSLTCLAIPLSLESLTILSDSISILF